MCHNVAAYIYNKPILNAKKKFKDSRSIVEDGKQLKKEKKN